MKKSILTSALIYGLNLVMTQAAPTSRTILPLVTGWFNDSQVLYIQSEASDPAVAQSQNVNYVPGLAGAANTDTVDDIYVFSNFSQANVVASAPSPLGPMNTDTAYSPLWQVNLVTWNAGVETQMLTSEAAISAAAASGKIMIQKTGIIVNCPIIYSPMGGTLPTATVIGEASQKSVILPLIQGWFDGAKVLYLQTEASDAGVAKDQNVNYVPRLAGAANKDTVDDIYVVSNFSQANVVGSSPHPFGPMNSNLDYSPLWQVTLVTWKDAGEAKLLTSEDAVNAAVTSGKATLQKTDIIVNCPIMAEAMPTVTIIGGPEISAARQASGLTINFTGTLQSADTAAGPWTDMAAISPVTIPFSGAGKLYRAKQ